MNAQLPITAAGPMPGAAPAAPSIASRWSAAGSVRLGIITAIVLVFGFGAWAAFASIAGAVVTQGRLRVESNRQVVQHPEGGVVSRILVKEGDKVGAGDVLIQLDGTQAMAQLGIVEARLFDTMARLGRLEAEQSGAAVPVFERELLDLAETRAEVAALVEGQRGLHRARLQTVASETEQLRERQTQIREEIIGLDAQVESISIQLGFIVKELTDQQSLLDRGLTQASRVLSLEREKARLLGQRGALQAQIAQARGRITEIEIQIVGRVDTRREEAISEARDLKATEAELKERRLALREVVDRLDIRAPRSGTVLGLSVFTEGAVIRPAEPVMSIVPDESNLVVDVVVPPNNINDVYPGQTARLRFSAFNARTTPEIDGLVRRVSPDALVNEQTGEAFYSAEIVLTEAGLAQLEGLTLIAGMPVEVFLQTGDRSPLSYLMRPFTDFFARAMRET